MNRHPNIIYALGCARGAAMAALRPDELDTLTGEQIEARILPLVGKAPMASPAQLEAWVCADDVAGLDGLLPGFRALAMPLPGIWGRRGMHPFGRRGMHPFLQSLIQAQAMAQAPAAAAPAAPAAPNWSQLHGLDELAGLSKKWKKRLKRLGGHIEKIAKVAVAPMQGGIKGIKAQAKVIKENPKAFLTAAIGLATGNPQAVLKSAADYKAARDARKAEQQAQEEQQQAMIAYQSEEPQSPRVYASRPPVAASYASYADYGLTEPAPGAVTRLPPEEDRPRVVGINWGGLVDHMKANPVPWGLGAAAGFYLLTRRK